MNFEELRDRNLKIVTDQFIRLANGSGSGSLQSAAFSANTRAIIIRGIGYNSQCWIHLKFGSNPTADYTCFPILGVPWTSPTHQDILTFNVTPGEKLAAFTTAVGDTRVHIIELGY